MPETTIQGYRLHYREAGSGRPVVLIHGMAGASGFWADTLKEMPEGFHGLAPDLLGFGDSEKPRIEYSIAGHAEMIRDFLLALGVSRADLIGHSMGGTIALMVTLLFPDRVGRLVLVNTPVCGGRSLHGRGWIGATVAGLTAVKVGLQIPWVLQALRKVRRYYFVLDPRFTEDAKKAPLYVLRSHARALRRTVLSDRLTEIKAPTLVMGTDRDGIVRREEFDLAAREIPGAREVRIRGAGHCPTLEEPGESHRAIFDFLKG